MAIVETITATEFKAKCLELFNRLNGQDLDVVHVTRRGRVVAIVKAPPPSEAAVGALLGYQTGTVTFPDDFDWTAPVLDEPWIDAAEHRDE